MTGNLSLEDLKKKIKNGEIDTVIAAFPDHLGQLMGKRLTGSYFLKAAEINCCDYLLTIDIEEVPLKGFGLSGWDKGYGDFVMKPDYSTLRELSWQPGSVILFCDLCREDGSPVNEAPRNILAAILNKLKTAGMGANMASELEFFMFDNPFGSVYESGYDGLKPSSPYPIDYAVLNTGFDDAILRQICNQVSASGIPVESRKGETGRGQHEIGLEYAEAMEMADRHLVYKNGAKTIADMNGRSLTFMAKYSGNEAGSSCHIHTSITDLESGGNVFSQNGAESDVFRYFLGGLCELSRDLFLFFAPTINSYKRFSTDSFAPTRIAWDYDNRTTSFRIVGSGESLRIENRLPGADANPYLAYAATLAAGLYGIENRIEPPEASTGNIYRDSSLPGVPGSLGEAADLLDKSAAARKLFGDSVIDHYVRHARIEVEAFRRNVSVWELKRYFERI